MMLMYDYNDDILEWMEMPYSLPFPVFHFKSTSLAMPWWCNFVSYVWFDNWFVAELNV